MIIESIFMKIIGMSLSASYIAAIVILLRIFFKKLPKTYSYFLWLIVFFRLICPFTIESALSLMPAQEAVEYGSSVISGSPQLEVGRDIVAKSVANYTGIVTNAAVAEEVSNTEILLTALGSVWILGVIAVFLYGAVSYLGLKRRVANSQYDNEGHYVCSNISAPFLLGIFKPEIYLPNGLTDIEKRHILAHERIHIRRFDFIVKPIAFIAMAIHWFNPFAWISFLLFSKDMEMAVDEAACKGFLLEERKEYSSVLLSVAMKQNGIFVPLAFGESNTKSRVKNIINFKKPRFYIVAAAMLVIITVACTMLTDRKNDDSRFLGEVSATIPYESAAIGHENSVSMAARRNVYNGNNLKDIKIFMLNPTENEAMYGEDYKLEKENDGQWYVVEPKEEISWNDIGIILPAANIDGGTRQLFTVDMTPYEGRLTEGRYRIIKRVFVEKGEYNEARDLAAYFYIDNNMQNEEELWSDSMFSYISENRTPYIGDNSRVSHLAGAVPAPANTILDGGIELQTSVEPYELKVYYSSVYNEGENSIFNSETEFKSAALLFASIENMGICTFYIEDANGYISLSYERSEFEKLFGELYPYSESGNQLAELSSKVDIYLDGGHEAAEDLTSLDYYISKSIIDYNADRFMDGEFKTEAHTVLREAEEDGKITVYAMVLYAEYNYEDGKIRDVGGSHSPIAITFTHDGGEYLLDKYWMPEDGSYYLPSLIGKFPEDLIGDIDTQDYIEKHIEECRIKAEEYFRNTGRIAE